jgi:hypothetical protein
VPGGLLDLGCCGGVVGFVARGELDGVHIGVLRREILERLSGRVACAGKYNRVWARSEGGGEGIADTTVGAGN